MRKKTQIGRAYLTFNQAEDEVDMPSNYRIRLGALLFALLFAVSACSSLDKARSLHNRGQDEAALEMAQKFLDEDEEVTIRIEAAGLIGKIGGQKAGEILAPILDDEVVAVKNAAIRNIGKIKYGPASEKLIEIGMTAKELTLEATAFAIRNIGPPAIDLLVTKYLNSSSAVERNRFKNLMLAVGPSVASGITKNLAGKSYFENRTNFELLIAFKSPEVADWLLKEIDNREVGEMVVEGLTKLGSLAVLSVMAKLEPLSNRTGSVDVKERLIRILGDVKAAKATGLLEKLTKDNSERVRQAADLALKKIRGF